MKTQLKRPAPTGETSAPPAPKTAKQLAAIRNQERVKSILLLAIPDEYLLKFQKLISQLEVYGAPISKEDINQKFLRNLPPSWNQIALIMRNKPDIDKIDTDDLYNNLRVYEDEMKRSSSSTSTSQNLAFHSSENTSSTNEVSTASGDFGVSTRRRFERDKNMSGLSAPNNNSAVALMNATTPSIQQLIIHQFGDPTNTTIQNHFIDYTYITI
ncbi:hypothetical protein Tco_0694030 [Tanacetum coccineum]